MKHEIEIPEGWVLEWEPSTFKEVINGTNDADRAAISIHIKKKQTKDFSFYVDQYLYENGSTNDQIVNWLSDDIISIAKHRLKTSQFSLVPWEIKIGLFRFICEEKGESVMSIFSTIGKHGTDYVDFVKKLPQEFIDDLFKNKN